MWPEGSVPFVLELDYQLYMLQLGCHTIAERRMSATAFAMWSHPLKSPVGIKLISNKDDAPELSAMLAHASMTVPSRPTIPTVACTAESLVAPAPSPPPPDEPSPSKHLTSTLDSSGGLALSASQVACSVSSV